jgi:hypothetical protein
MPDESLSWGDFARTEAELAAYGKARLLEGIAFLATSRRDGSPRVHPVSPDIVDGHLLVFMEPTSPKGHDLRRDARYALHAHVAPYAPDGEFVCRGTAKAVTGEMRVEFGRKVPQMAERYVLFEFLIEEALRTVYVEKRPVRTRWTSSSGIASRAR